MADPKSPAADPGGAERKAKILELAERTNVKFMRLQFTDILGVIKNVEIPNRQFASALDGQIMFDGSSIEGFVRIEESDMFLRPDLSTFRVLPGTQHTGERIGRLICDIHNPDGSPFEGCPRHALKRAIAKAAAAGYSMHCGPEAEFFLFQTRDGQATTDTHDAAGYFDLAPVDLGEDVRRQIVLALESIGIDVEAAHHEVAAGQHEIDFRQDDVLITADNVSTFRFIVKNVAKQNGLHATFMPKPVYGRNGSGLHLLQSLVARRRPERLPGRRRAVAVEPHLPQLHRRAAAARQGLLLDHQPARELLQAAGAGLRGADQHRVVGAQPQPAGARPGAARRRDRRRAARARSVVQPLPRARGHAVRRARRHRRTTSIPVRPSTRTSTR